MKGDFFSVVIPVYNREKFIGSTIHSVLKQSFKRFELIVVDDGSSDGSAEIIQSVKDDRLSYHYITNSERGAARNYGIKQSKGEYIVFLDSDDIMLHNHLQELFNVLKDKRYDFIATKFFCINEKGEEKYYPEIQSLQEGSHDYTAFLKGNMLACNFCVRRDNSKLILFQESRSLSIMEDWLFLLQNLILNEIFILDKYTIVQKDHPERSMVSDNKCVIERKLNAANWLVENIQINPSDWNKLWAHAYYFIAVHFYLDFNRVKGIRYAFLAFKFGCSAFSVLKLTLKLIIGKRVLNLFK